MRRWQPFDVIITLALALLVLLGIGLVLGLAQGLIHALTCQA